MLDSGGIYTYYMDLCIKSACRMAGRQKKTGLCSDFPVAAGCNFAHQHSQQEHQISQSSEADDVNKDIPGSGNDFMHIGVDGQEIFKVGADVEHIEFFPVQNAAMVNRFVQDQSNAQSHSKDGNGLQEGAVLQLYIAGCIEINGHSDHRTVADHRLDIDTDGFNENIAGVEHNRCTGKEAEGRKIRTQTVVEFTLFGQTCQQTDVHRRGAELEGESVPRIIKSIVVCCRETENHLLVNFQNDHQNGSDQ